MPACAASQDIIRGTLKNPDKVFLMWRTNAHWFTVPSIGVQNPPGDG
jgi:hypothetical protein